MSEGFLVRRSGPLNGKIIHALKSDILNASR
jgi:hypothetical protein